MSPRYAVPLAIMATLATAADDRPAPKPAAEPVGEPVSCIPLAQIRETRVRDDWTIDFIGGGNRVWRNTLGSRCPGLRAEDAITYKTSLSQLCSTDIVYVLESAGGLHRGPSCNIGQFVPVRLVKEPK